MSFCDPMKSVITVCGSGALHCKKTDAILQVAEQIGTEIARQHAILVCGGRGGVMEAACRGAKHTGGTTIGILPGSGDEGNAFLDVCIPTRLGHMRNYLVAQSGDVVIALGGRFGTLNELSYAFMLGKPVVLVEGTGGVVDFLLSSGFFEDFGVDVHRATSAVEAVALALKCCGNHK